MDYMKEALVEAKKAYEIGEVPVGCVIVLKNEIIARAHNMKENQNRVIAHAEILAIEKANYFLGNWRLIECEMYVTLEPCHMCAGAITASRINKLTYACIDDKYGAYTRCAYLKNDEIYRNRKTKISFKSDDNCEKLINEFFQKIRKK